MTKKVIQPQSIVRSKGDNAITVHANWQHIDKVSPLFKCLMTLLLCVKIKDGEKAIERNRTAAG
jgi:hypothetical protein